MLLLINRSLLPILIALNINNYKVGTVLLSADLHNVSNRKIWYKWQDAFVAEGWVWDDPSPEDFIQKMIAATIDNHNIIVWYILYMYHNKQVNGKKIIMAIITQKKILWSYYNNNNMTIQVPRSMRIASLFFSSWQEEVLLSLWFLQMNILLQDYHSQIRSQAGPVIENMKLHVVDEAIILWSAMYTVKILWYYCSVLGKHPLPQTQFWAVVDASSFLRLSHAQPRNTGEPALNPLDDYSYLSIWAPSLPFCGPYSHLLTILHVCFPTFAGSPVPSVLVTYLPLSSSSSVIRPFLEIFPWSVTGSL